MNIKIKYSKGAKKIKQNGDWIDLFPLKSIIFNYPEEQIVTNGTHETKEIIFDSKIVSLGVAMKLPKYFEALMLPRSSTFIKQGLMMSNSMGIIDNAYSGESDVWGFPAVALRKTVITQDKAICQFRIQPTMNAPWWIKLKWLFTSKINFIEVDVLTDKSRGGFGSTDKN